MKSQKTQLCAYGCSNIAKHKNKSNKWMCLPSSNSCPANRLKNSKATKKVHDDGLRNQKEIYKSLSQDNKDKMNWSKGKMTADFSYSGKGNHKGILIKERGYKCECCQNDKWLGSDIVLELEHIDGDNKNNNKENLKLLCPNCHSQTETWRGRKSLKLNTNMNIPSPYLIQGKNKKHKALIIKERGYKCECCQKNKWLESDIILELEHIDGDNKNNNKENLKLLCPNCHSHTDTWRGRKKTIIGVRKHSEETIIEAIKSSINMNQVLKKLDYRYGSHTTVRRVMDKYELEFIRIDKSSNSS